MGVILLKVTLCGKKGCCPTVEVTDKGAEIGEGSEKAKLSKDEWNSLVDEIEQGSLEKI